MKKSLSNREEQILKLLLAEYSQIEICNILKLSQGRVSDVKAMIMEKWEVDTIVGLVKKVIERGYLDIEDDS
ncbi:MAG: LuxR C-terminal-related transcriptional regulator [Crocinitomicaceae bacterium]|nr:LuxR C-terminal-related transcriptional regulator [Flavobacteriaceae bacterium]MDG1741985.1 LuxR C-terminal-related transcriptional regulator [Crocinitomicaceae bacterium]